MFSQFHHSIEAKKRKAVLVKKARAYGKKVQLLKKNKNAAAHEYALYIAGDTKYQQSIQKALVSFKGVKHVVLVGIGGSNLGTEAVYQALAFKTGPQLFVLDAIEQDNLLRFEGFIKQTEKLSDIAIVIVSKSGTTTETMLNAGKVLEICEQKFGDACHARCIFIGDKDTPFWKIGKKKKVVCIPVPDSIGGRYSVFSAVGMVPLTLLGIDVTALREGAVAALESAAQSTTESAAVDLVLHTEAGVHAVNFFTFNDRLRKCGYWYRQLLAESIGKTMTKKKTTFVYQLLPIVSSSVDLHSMAQLFLGGYKNLYTHFVTFNESSSTRLPGTHWLISHMPLLAGRDAMEVKRAITDGVLEAYNDQKLPYRYTELQKCSAHEVGYLLNSLMYEVMCLGVLFDVDPFDQPQVELYKKHMRSFLK